MNFAWNDTAWQTDGDWTRIRRIAEAAVCVGKSDQEVADYINAERPIASQASPLTAVDAIRLLTADEIDAGALDTPFAQLVGITGYEGNGTEIELLQEAVLANMLNASAAGRFAAAANKVVYGSICRLSPAEGGLGRTTDLPASDVAYARTNG